MTEITFHYVFRGLTLMKRRTSSPLMFKVTTKYSEERFLRLACIDAKSSRRRFGITRIPS